MIDIDKLIMNTNNTINRKVFREIINMRQTIGYGFNKYPNTLPPYDDLLLVNERILRVTELMFMKVIINYEKK